MSKQVAFLWMIVLLLCAVFMAFAGGEIEAQTRVKAFPDDPLSTEADRKFIRRTYEIARKAAANGYRPYAALLVHEGRILAEHENTVNQSGNITKHAEVNLLGMATEKFPRDILSKSTLYTSGEPCLMCCGLIESNIHLQDCFRRVWKSDAKNVRERISRNTQQGVVSEDQARFDGGGAGV